LRDEESFGWKAEKILHFVQNDEVVFFEERLCSLNRFKVKRNAVILSPVLWDEESVKRKAKEILRFAQNDRFY